MSLSFNTQSLIGLFLSFLLFASAFLHHPTIFHPSTKTFPNSHRRMNLYAQLGRVTMYKKEGCPFCAKAIDLLENKYQLKINYVDVQDPDSAKREEILYQMRTFSGGRNTVPQIFFNAEHLGGNDDIQQLEKDGKLLEKVEKVKNTPVSTLLDNWYHPWY